MIDDFRCFAENSPDALASILGDGRIHFMNSRFQTLFLYGQAGADVRRLDDLCVSPPIRDALAGGIRQALRAGGEQRIRLTLPVAERSVSYCCRIVPTPELDGDSHVLLEIRDATAIHGDACRQAAAPLHQTPETGRQRRTFFSVLDEFPAFVYMQRRDYTVAYANKKVSDLYGETESRLCYEVFAGRQTPCPVCPTFEVFETGQSIEWEFTDEKDRTFRIYDYPFENDTGEPLVMELGIDVTDLKRVENELLQAQKLRAIGVLAGGLAHDLNNNLVPIIFNIDHALARVTDDSAREPLSEALQAAYRAAKLVEQVLEYSRQQDISRAPLPITPLVRESVESFRLSQAPSIRLNAELTAGQDCVLANAAQIQQVMMNLLQNAAQAMPEGGVITVTLADEAGCHPEPKGLSANNLRLSVTDTGHGIPDNAMERIFEPFFTTKKSTGGTGMGLAVVYAIINGSNGTITVDSQPGKGTTFTILLPRVPAPALPPADECCVIQGNCGSLLLVDDDSGVLSAMARTLRDANFEVETATSGEAGLRTFARQPSRFVLVLADQSMPGMNGITMATKMLTIDNRAIIIICTGHVEPALEKQAREQGVVDFAIKPLTPHALIKMVRKYCP